MARNKYLTFLFKNQLLKATKNQRLSPLIRLRNKNLYTSLQKRHGWYVWWLMYTKAIEIPSDTVLMSGLSMLALDRHR